MDHPRNPGRDASAAIAGYVYQVNVTVQRWLNLGANEHLELEAGEDIDIVRRARADDTSEAERATHPLMSCITTSLDPKHRGQITGLATFSNFVGMAIGALVFGRLMVPHFSIALVCFACGEFGAGVLALYAFHAEAPTTG
jgi:hypothetical protein